MPSSSESGAHDRAAAVPLVSRRRSPSSEDEQARREAWGKEWGQIGSDAGKKAKGES